MKLLIFICLFTQNIYAQDLQKHYLLNEDVSQSDPIEFKNSPELYLENESELIDIDDEIGVVLDPRYTGKENSNISFATHSAMDLNNISKILTFELQYHKKFSNYQNSWWGVLLKQTNAKYSAIAEELSNSGSNNPSADSNTLRENNNQTINSIGIGMGHRFKFLSEINKSNRLFEKVNTFITYNLSNDSTNDTAYQGLGFIAEYGLHYRTGESFYYGGKIAYNILTAERTPENEEELTDRSLVFGYSSMALELGYYY